MIAFHVNDMTCGHCASTITRSLKAADPKSRVTIDLGRQLVMIEPADADGDELREAIAEAGYSPAPVDVTAVEAPAHRGGCSGPCH